MAGKPVQAKRGNHQQIDKSSKDSTGKQHSGVLGIVFKKEELVFESYSYLFGGYV